MIVNMLQAKSTLSRLVDSIEQKRKPKLLLPEMVDLRQN